MMKLRINPHQISISVVRLVLTLTVVSAISLFVLIIFEAKAFFNKAGSMALLDKSSPLQVFAGPLVSLLALFFVMLAYFVQARGERRSQNHRMIEMIMRFDDDYFREVRNQAWGCRSRWYHLPEPQRAQWRLNLIASAVPIPVEGGVANQHSSERLTDEETRNRAEQWSVFRMLNLYQSLAFLECDDRQLSNISFFYPYWRGFLYDVVNLYEQLYEKAVKLNERAVLPRERWKQSLTLLDQRLRLPRYDEQSDSQLRSYQDSLKTIMTLR
jgi:hypothetical protein